MTAVTDNPYHGLGMSSIPSITVAALGSDSPLSQVGRIRQGLLARGGIVLTEDLSLADLIYVNNPPYDVPLRARAEGCLKPDARLMFNVLDVPSHLLPPNGDYTFTKLAQLGDQLNQAHAITAISRFTQSQLKHYLGLDSYLVYNPIKPVTPEKRLRGERPYPEYRVLMAGRVGDPNKRQRQIGIPALLMAGFEEHEVAVVGGEYLGWGMTLGTVADEVLNDLYNSVDFIMQPSFLGGWEMPVSEAVICGAIPIVTTDLTTREEHLLPRHWFCHPSPTAVAYWLRGFMDDPTKLAAARELCLTSIGPQLASQLSPSSVATRILEVYRNIAPSSVEVRELRAPEGWTLHPEIT